MSAVIIRSRHEARRLTFFCPGCETIHSVHDGPNGWTFDGDYERPTLSPSVLVQGVTTPTCHSFVRGGRIEFLGDCAHGMAGQTVDLEPVPEPWASAL